jgi:hypothetical protein
MEIGDREGDGLTGVGDELRDLSKSRLSSSSPHGSF